MALEIQILCQLSNCNIGYGWQGRCLYGLESYCSLSTSEGSHTPFQVYHRSSDLSLMHLGSLTLTQYLLEKLVILLTIVQNG